jgi:hypothetical protein
MIQIPENNVGGRKRLESIERLLEALGSEAIAMSCFEDISCIAPIARNAALMPQFRQRNNPTVEAQNNSQCCSSTFYTFHLQNCGSADTTSSAFAT